MVTPPLPPARCIATVRSKNSPHYGERCRRAPIPCGRVCIKHGGYLPSVRAQAERAYFALLRGDYGWLPAWRKTELIRSFERAQRAWSAKQDRKYGITTPLTTPDDLVKKYLTPDERKRYAEQARQRTEEEQEDWWSQ